MSIPLTPSSVLYVDGVNVRSCRHSSVPVSQNFSRMKRPTFGVKTVNDRFTVTPSLAESQRSIHFTLISYIGRVSQ